MEIQNDMLQNLAKINLVLSNSFSSVLVQAVEKLKTEVLRLLLKWTEIFVEPKR